MGKFFEHITESIWSDIQDRSSGEVVRKEDDVNLLDLNEFYAYIKDQYKTKVEYIDLDAMGGGNGDVLGVDITEDIILFYKPKRGHILLSWSKVKIPMPFFDELTDRFKVENPNPMRRIITEKDGSCTNKTFIDVIEFFLGHKDGLVNESIWSDIQDRSSGEVVRKEDELTEKDRKDLDKLIVSYANEFVYGKGYSFDFFKMNTDARNLDDFCYYIEIDNEVEDLNKDKILQYVKDYWADKLCDDVGGAIEQAELKYHQDMNESIWSDLQDRSSGEVTRKEDDIPKNIKDVLPDYINLFVNRCYYQGDYDVQSMHDFKAFIRDFANNKRIYTCNPDVEELRDFVDDHWDDILKDLILMARNEVDKAEEELADKLWDELHKGDSVSESIWADLQDRSSGKVKRVEDIVHLDDKYKDKFEICLERFVETIVYEDEYQNTIEDFKKFLADNRSLVGEVWVGNSTKPFREVIEPYIDDNWSEYDNISKQINDRILDEKKKISKLGFKKEPGKSIKDTICDWWDNLDDDTKYDLMMDAPVMSREEEEFYETHLDDDEFTGEDLEVDDLFDRSTWEELVGMYVDNISKNESIWSDIQDRSSGDVTRKEDEMHDMDFKILMETAKMFKHTVRVCSDTANRIPFHYNDTCKDFVKYIKARKDEHFWNDVDDKTYDKIIKFVKDNWGDCKSINEFTEKYISDLNECDGVPGGVTPGDIGGMGPAYFPGPNGEPGSGDLPSPTGIVYHQVAPFGLFIKDLKKKKKKKKKFRIEDEPCAHSKNSKTYDYVDDFREYVDRTYNNMDRRK